MSEWKRRLRGVVGSAVIWGVACGGAFLGGYLVMGTLGRLESGLGLLDGLGMAIRVGIMGGIAGAAVATLIGFMYRGRRLASIDWRRFGIGAGLATAVFVPLFMQTMNVLSGDGMVAWRLIDGDALFMGICGGVIAAGTMKLAQRADAAAARRGELTDGSGAVLSPAAAARDVVAARTAENVALH